MTLLRPASSWNSPAGKLCSLALASLSCPLRPGGGRVCSGGKGWVGGSIYCSWGRSGGVTWQSGRWACGVEGRGCDTLQTEPDEWVREPGDRGYRS